MANEEQPGNTFKEKLLAIGIVVEIMEPTRESIEKVWPIRAWLIVAIKFAIQEFQQIASGSVFLCVAGSFRPALHQIVDARNRRRCLP